MVPYKLQTPTLANVSMHMKFKHNATGCSMRDTKNRQDIGARFDDCTCSPRVLRQVNPGPAAKSFQSLRNCLGVESGVLQLQQTQHPEPNTPNLRP